MMVSTPRAGGWRGPDSFQSGGNHTVSISGGTVVIDADGDGLDSNGSLTISGGLVLVSGPTNSGNGALDYDGSCTVTGGVLIAAGSAGMAQAPGSSSTQAVLMITYTSTQPAGTLIGLTDAKGGLFPGEGLPVGDYLHPHAESRGTLYPIQRRHLQRRRHQRVCGVRHPVGFGRALDRHPLRRCHQRAQRRLGCRWGRRWHGSRRGRRLRRPSRTVKKKRSPRRL